MTFQSDAHILIDARPTMGGVSRYAYELANLIKSYAYHDQISLYGQGPTERFLAVSSAQGARYPLRVALGDCKRIVADQLLLPLAALRNRAELVHSTNYLVPLLTRKPVVVTCHDLSLLNYFSTKKAGLMKYYERFILLDVLKRAAHLIVPSNTVAAEIKKRFRLPDSKVTTIYPPLPPFCFETASEKKLPELPILKQPFFLSVGTLEPRKNISGLLQGWQQAFPLCRIPLVVTGPYGWQQRQLVDQHLSGSDSLYWTGDVDDSTLSALYRKATAVVQYSLAEGFDYPVAEALCMGTPVIASDIAVHREVLAGCGLMASATDPEILAARMLEVCSWSAEQLTDFRRRAGKRANLLKRCSTAERYFSLYRQVLGKTEIML